LPQAFRKALLYAFAGGGRLVVVPVDRLAYSQEQAKNSQISLERCNLLPVADARIGGTGIPFLLGTRFTSIRLRS